MSISSSSLHGPIDLAFDFWWNLWVSDGENNRILMYKAARRKPDLFFNGQSASVVLGQQSFTSNEAPDPPTASSLKNPAGIAFDGCNLWVADWGNNRVIMYKADPNLPDLFSNGQSASVVLGQQSFTSNSTPKFGNVPAQEPLSENVLPEPSGIAFDSDRNLWVAGWARVLRFSFPISSSQPASLVVGKPNFVIPDTNDPGLHPTESLLWAASDVIFDQSGNMWVSDRNDERILMYKADPNLPDLFSNGQSASVVLGQVNLMTRPPVDQLNATASTIFSPQGIAFDLRRNLWTADLGYSRILRYSNPFPNGQAASLVLGQSSFSSLEAPDPPTASSLKHPGGGIAFDHAGNLWVADQENNRVLRYSRPFSNGQAASLVLGQSSFTSNAN